MKETVVAYVNALSLADQLVLLKGDRVPLIDPAVQAAADAAAATADQALAHEEAQLEEAEALAAQVE